MGILSQDLSAINKGWYKDRQLFIIRNYKRETFQFMKTENLEMFPELHIIEKLKISPYFPMAVTHIEHIHIKALFMQTYTVHTQVNFELVHSFHLLDLSERIRERM